MRLVTRNIRTLQPALVAALCLALGGCVSAGTNTKTTPGTNRAMTQQHHTIDYVEFTVLDLAEAKRFYGAAFDWTFNDYGPEYAGIRGHAGGEVGGMIQRPEVERGGPLVVLYSADLEGSVEAVRDAGGRLVKEPFAFPGGRRFHFLDPSGNELAVWSEE